MALGTLFFVGAAGAAVFVLSPNFGGLFATARPDLLPAPRIDTRAAGTVAHADVGVPRG